VATPVCDIALAFERLSKLMQPVFIEMKRKGYNENSQ
jgi:hypothetical protein